MGILVRNLLKLLVGRSGAFIRAAKTGLVRLWRHVRRTHCSVQSPDCPAHLDTGLFVLLVQVVPRPDPNADDHQCDNGADHQRTLMIRRPVDGLLGSIDRGPAESILFQLMAGFCAHELPFYWL